MVGFKSTILGFVLYSVSPFCFFFWFIGCKSLCYFRSCFRVYSVCLQLVTVYLQVILILFHFTYSIRTLHQYVSCLPAWPLCVAIVHFTPVMYFIYVINPLILFYFCSQQLIFLRYLNSNLKVIIFTHIVTISNTFHSFV